jgi:hypothetical protein
MISDRGSRYGFGRRGHERFRFSAFIEGRNHAADGSLSIQKEPAMQVVTGTASSRSFRICLNKRRARWIPTRSATPSTALVPQRKVKFPIPNAGLLRSFQGKKTARREGISSPFSDAGVALRPRTQAQRVVEKISRQSQTRRESVRFDSKPSLISAAPSGLAPRRDLSAGLSRTP